MPITLRPYQKKFVDEVRKQFKSGVKKVCGVAPCGAGKTIMTGWMIREAFQNGKRSIFFVHRKELIDQTSKTFHDLNIPHGIIAADSDFKPELPVQIASVQTLINRLNQIPEPDFLICDECHHILSKTYLQIIKHWSDSYLLGVTATPQRMGGVRLGDVFQSLVLAPSVKDLITLGNLTDFKYFAPDLNLDFSGVHVRRGDYVKEELAYLMDNFKIIADTVENYKKYANRRSAICYCVNVAHSKNVAERFNAAGIPAAHVDGETDKSERARIIEDFRNGRFKVLCNVELFGEGFDVPNMDAVILARPTKSLTLFIQQALRPLRPNPQNKNKIAAIIDCADNVFRFGLPDADRVWSLAPNAKKESKPAPTKICPHCRQALPLSAKFCECGYEFDFKDLLELGADLLDIPKRFYTYLRIAKKRGYQPQWAVYQFLENGLKSFDELVAIRKFMNYKEGWQYYKAREYLYKDSDKD